MIAAVEERRRERGRLIARATEYAGALAKRLDLCAVVVAGSVARGDFNVWSDIDVVVIAEDLPERVPDRELALIAGAPARVQPVGFTPAEFEAALAKGNPLAREAVDAGVAVAGELPGAG
ncbi:MAG: hypothetical protein FJW90_01535 [Actinobacteria bacterium]|nr:hypothetical protein [Actinomycetota bacterium]